MLRRFRHLFERGRRRPGDAQAVARQRMIQRDLIDRGISSQRVLECMARVPRERFVDEPTRLQAYADQALPIACEQTISQPYIVALMTQLLDVEPENRVLEIGTGSGYQTAVLAELAHDVVTVERHGALARKAQQTLAELNYENITFAIGDGSLGWPEKAPYDRILVTAAAEEVPPALLEQLGAGGLLVAPIGSRSDQRLQVLAKEEGSIRRRESVPCRFVPLVGEQGFPPQA